MDYQALKDFLAIMSPKYKKLDDIKLNINYIHKSLKYGLLKYSEDIQKELVDLENEKCQIEKDIEEILKVANKK